MEPGTWIALGAMLVAAIAMLINLTKAIRERRAEDKQDAEKATKAGAERDSIAVHSAESALLLMERMLNQANVLTDKANARADQAEDRLKLCVDQYAVLQRDCHRKDS